MRQVDVKMQTAENHHHSNENGVNVVHAKQIRGRPAYKIVDNQRGVINAHTGTDKQRNPVKDKKSYQRY